MELRQLVTFRMVALTLNFSRAAAALNYVPSNVSMQIQSLEDELGVKLVDRLNKQIVLTDAGKRFYVHVERILNCLEEAKSDLSNSETFGGNLTISANEILCVYLLPTVLHQFRDKYPGVSLIFRPTPHEHLKQSIYDGITDVVFILDEPITSTGLNIEPLREERFHLLVAPNHRLARLSEIHSEDLRREFFLVHEKGCSYRTMFDRLIAREGAENVTYLEFGSAEAMKQCAMLGTGIAFLPEISAASEIERGQLITLPIDLEELRIVTQMVWHKGKWISPAIEAFLDIVREAFHDLDYSVN